MSVVLSQSVGFSNRRQVATIQTDTDGSATWDFPVPFVGVPSVTIAVMSSDPNVMATAVVTSKSKSQVKIQVQKTSSQTLLTVLGVQVRLGGTAVGVTTVDITASEITQ